MSYVNEALSDIRSQIAADDHDLSEARRRRDLTRKLANLFPGSLTTFQSGSLAHGTVNDPVSDADCAVVLDPDEYPTLGPDTADDEPPAGIVEAVREFVRERIGEHGYPDAYFLVTKRAIKIFFRSPLPSGNDPTADLVVALSRRDARGYWIPNLDQERWDASDPKGHVEMLRLPNENVARLRRRVIRLVKAWNKQYAEPALSSFNITALALECINETMSEGEALSSFFDHGARQLERHLTPDPAGVSGDLKLLKDKGTALRRLRNARDNMRAALDAADECDARDSLADVFWKYQLVSGVSKDSIAAALRGASSSPAFSHHPQKPVRSYASRSLRRSGARSKTPWFLRAQAFQSALRELKSEYPELDLNICGIGPAAVLRISGPVSVPNYTPRLINIEFGVYSDSHEPRVTIVNAISELGLPVSPHRYPDGSLCIWYPSDGAERKWMLEDGLAALVTLVRVHLFKEAWWREHKEWLGPQAPHVA